MSAGNTKDPNVYSKTDLTYTDYLKVPELIQLQKPLSNPEHHDEMLFIIIHQAYELWFKLMIHELEFAMDYMAKGEVLRAHHFVKRVVEIQKVLVQQIHILETMTPIDFLAFREHLMPASGFQSLQHREIEFLCGLKDERYLQYFKNRPEIVERLKERLAGPDLSSAFLALVRSLGYTVPAKDSESDREAIIQGLRPIYQDPAKDLPLYLLAESLVDLDQGLSLWREHHVRVVERIIGFKKGTGGSSGAEYLRSQTAKKAFPYLWDVRCVLELPK
jgi:tryptophan 2,3-dioxygenase